MVKPLPVWRDKHPPTMQKQKKRAIDIWEMPLTRNTPKQNKLAKKKNSEKNKAGHKRKSLKKRKHCILEIRITESQEVPVGAVVKTSCFQCGGHGFSFWRGLGEERLRSHMLQCQKIFFMTYKARKCLKQLNIWEKNITFSPSRKWNKRKKL